LDISIVSDIGDIEADAWNRLVGDSNPFVEHAFLAALESSGSVGGEAGWGPAHVVVHDGGRLIGAAPMYVKGHSYGEYIFDWSWANAAQQMGIRYYPKLVSAVPFTPAAGPRLLVHPDADSESVLDALTSGMRSMADHIGASSIHVLFTTEAQREALGSRGLLERLTYQFHWENKGYVDFADYLARFRSSERRKVRKERREATASGLTIQTLRGGELSDAQLQHVFAFYRDTTGRKGAIPYLNEGFFAELNRSLAHLAVVVLASDGDRPVAGALSFEKGKHLYGRYWGCLEDYDKLHFELCYYQHIERAIALGYDRFEAGAQGQHKIKRGLMPAPTHSAHWIADPTLSEAVADYLPREAAANRQEMEALAASGPFRREPDGESA
jgi:predicted N-acyltransferase